MRRSRDEQVVKTVVYETVCDACGKTEGPDPDGWHHFTSYHGDWGNDSIESHKHHDVCSWSCYVTVVREVFDDYGEPPIRGERPGGPRRRLPTLTIDDKDWWFVRDMLRARGIDAADGDAAQGKLGGE